MARVQTSEGSTLGKPLVETISIDREELRSIVREHVRKKFAALAESKKKEPRFVVTEAGSVFGKMQPESMAGGVPGAIEPIGESDRNSEIGKSPADELEGPATPSPKSKKVRRAAPRSIASHDAAVELLHYMENDEEIWAIKKPAFDKNLLLKMKKGIYNPIGAAKFWLYLVDFAAKKYVRNEAGSRGRVDSVFNLATRKLVASALVEMFEEEHYTPKEDEAV